MSNSVAIARASSTGWYRLADFTGNLDPGDQQAIMDLLSGSTGTTVLMAARLGANGWLSCSWAPYATNAASPWDGRYAFRFPAK